MVIDWNKWRKTYNSSTVEEQIEFYDKVFDKYPNQDRYNLSRMLDFFQASGAKTVVEIGGWTGNAARDVLAQRPDLELWINYEICHAAVRKTTCTDHRFSNIAVYKWPWDMHLMPTQAMVASHSLEHMTKDNIHALLCNNPKWQACYVDCPLVESGKQVWDDFNGTHILECNWQELEALFAQFGFRVERYGSVRFFLK